MIGCRLFLEKPILCLRDLHGRESKDLVGTEPETFAGSGGGFLLLE